MKQSLFEITGVRQLSPWMWEMRLAGDCGAITAPGQFVNLQLDGFFLRRPISVADVARAAAPDGRDVLTLAYKVVGRGTAAMAQLHEGAWLDVLTGLGNGYDLDAAGEHPVLLGGGAGVPPMLWTARLLRERGAQVDVVMAFNTAAEAFYVQEFEEAGATVHVATMDGTMGTKGFATDVLPGIPYTHFYCCGPKPMMRAVAAATATSGQFSLEERMGCGFGACMGCTCKTADGGHKRICKEGPVLRKEEISWDD